MARARNIKPSLFRNEILGVLDPCITLLFQSLWCLADREGRLEDRPIRIKADTFPYRENIDVNGYLTVLEHEGFILRYEVAGKRYIQIINFRKHQSPHKTERPSEIPEPPAGSMGCTTNGGAPLDNGSPTVKESLIPDSLIPDSLVKPGRKKFIKPTLAEVEAYCRERGNSVDPQAWMDHYTSNGWRVGRNPMRDWKAAVRTWENSRKGNGHGAHQQDTRSRAKRVSDKLDEIARRDLEERGNAEGVGSGLVQEVSGALRQ